MVVYCWADWHIHCFHCFRDAYLLAANVWKPAYNKWCFTVLRNLRVDSTITTVLWQPTAPGTPLSTVEKVTWARENTWVCVGVELSCHRMAIGIADCGRLACLTVLVLSNFYVFLEIREDYDAETWLSSDHLHHRINTHKVRHCLALLSVPFKCSEWVQYICKHLIK